MYPEFASPKKINFTNEKKKFENFIKLFVFSYFFTNS